MANFQNVLKAVAQSVLDAKVSVVDELLAFLGTKVEVDDDLKAIFAEFKGTLKVEKVVAPKKGGKKSSDEDEEPKKKRAASIFNLYVKDMMPVLKEKHPEVKNGKELMTLASESWKTDPLGLFVKEKVVGLKKANPEWDNVELYKAAKAAFEGEEADEAEPEETKQQPKASKGQTKAKAKVAASEDEASDKEEEEKPKASKAKPKATKGKGKKAAKPVEEELSEDALPSSDVE
jgi:hypothetical protein